MAAALCIRYNVIQRNEWAEAQSADGQSRVIDTYGVGSDFVTILINRDRKWAIMVRTGLDSDVTVIFKEVLNRAKGLNNNSFEGIAVKTIGGTPHIMEYC